MKEPKYPALTNKMRENAIERILARKVDKEVDRARMAFENLVVEEWKRANPYPYTLDENLAKAYLETTNKVQFGSERISLEHNRVYCRNNDTWYSKTENTLSLHALNAYDEWQHAISKQNLAKSTLNGIFFGATSIKAIIKDFPDLALFLPGPIEDSKGTALVDPNIALKVKEMLALEIK